MTARVASLIGGAVLGVLIVLMLLYGCAATQPQPRESCPLRHWAQDAAPELDDATCNGLNLSLGAAQSVVDEIMDPADAGRE